jgi:hypothetical protein
MRIVRATDARRFLRGEWRISDNQRRSMCQICTFLTQRLSSVATLKTLRFDAISGLAVRVVVMNAFFDRVPQCLCRHRTPPFSECDRTRPLNIQRGDLLEFLCGQIGTVCDCDQLQLAKHLIRTADCSTDRQGGGLLSWLAWGVRPEVSAEPALYPLLVVRTPGS